ncbi:MAG: hypothetical protein WCG85_11800 [Polyangia bacterium]
MKKSRCFLSSLVVFLSVLALSSQAMAAGKAAKTQTTVNKVVEINKQALAQMQAGKFDQARDALWGAIAVLTDANMSDHEIAARTHVHLAAVYLTGFNDKNKAIRQLAMALKINPGIKITPQVETPALDEALDAARNQASLPPVARTSAAPTAPMASADEGAPSTPSASGPASGGSAAGGLRAGKKLADIAEPAAPDKAPEPFFCPLPTEVPPKQDIFFRCITQKQPKRSTATLFYRESGSEDFTPVPMTRSPQGWLSANVPAAAVTGNAFQYYLEAKVPGVKEPLTIGSSDGPELMPIVEGAATMNNRTLSLLLQGKDTSMKAAPMADDQAPLEEINKQFKEDEELRKYHRRLAGSFFFALGGGTGSTYHGKVNPDSHESIWVNRPTRPPELQGLVQISAGYSLASMFQLVPELGYQVTDRFAISLQGRIQYASLDSQGWLTDDTKAKTPPSWALAVFLRGQYAFFNAGNFQFFASGIAGGGTRAFMGYVPKACTDKAGYTCPTTGTDHSDTISAGPVAFGAGAGVMYHLSRDFALWLEVRGLASVSPIMVLAEGNGGVAFAYKFDFEKSSEPPPPETMGGWERPPEEREAPPADAPSSE